MPRIARHMSVSRPSLEGIREQLKAMSPEQRSLFVEAHLTKLLGPAFQALAGGLGATVVHALLDEPVAEENAHMRLERKRANQEVLADLAKLLAADEAAKETERTAAKRSVAAFKAAETRRRRYGIA